MQIDPQESNIADWLHDCSSHLIDQPYLKFSFLLLQQVSFGCNNKVRAAWFKTAALPVMQRSIAPLIGGTEIALF